MDYTGYLAGFSADFQNYISQLNERLLELEGISPDYLNVQEMAHRYCQENSADMSVDSNANRNEGKTYCGYLHEVTSGWYKLQGYYDIYNKMVQLYGIATS